MRAALWNMRSALLYSIGGWTVLGGVLHYSYSSGGGHGTGPVRPSEPEHGASNRHRGAGLGREGKAGLRGRQGAGPG